MELLQRFTLIELLRGQLADRQVATRITESNDAAFAQLNNLLEALLNSRDNTLILDRKIQSPSSKDDDSFLSEVDAYMKKVKLKWTSRAIYY